MPERPTPSGARSGSGTQKKKKSSSNSGNDNTTILSNVNGGAEKKEKRSSKDKSEKSKSNNSKNVKPLTEENLMKKDTAHTVSLPELPLQSKKAKIQDETPVLSPQGHMNRMKRLAQRPLKVLSSDNFAR